MRDQDKRWVVEHISAAIAKHVRDADFITFDCPFCGHPSLGFKVLSKRQIEFFRSNSQNGSYMYTKDQTEAMQCVVCGKKFVRQLANPYVEDV